MPNDLDIPMPRMAPAEASYRARRPLASVDPSTRRLALIAGGIGVALLALVGIWALSGHHRGTGGVPLVEADARPWRSRPEKQPALADGQDDGAAGATDTLAPPPEVPAPQTLKNEADRLNATSAVATPTRTRTPQVCSCPRQGSSAPPRSGVQVNSSERASVQDCNA